MLRLNGHGVCHVNGNEIGVVDGDVTISNVAEDDKLSWALERLSLRPDEVLVLRTYVKDPRQIREIQGSLDRFIRNKFPQARGVVLAEGMTFEKLDPEQMRAAGWQRSVEDDPAAVLALIEDCLKAVHCHTYLSPLERDLFYQFTTQLVTEVRHRLPAQSPGPLATAADLNSGPGVDTPLGVTDKPVQDDRHLSPSYKCGPEDEVLCSKCNINPAGDDGQCGPCWAKTQL